MIEKVFSLSSALVMPFWFLMIVFPHWRWTNRVMQSVLVFVPVAVLYALLVLPRFGDIFMEVVNPSLSSISTLLGTPGGSVSATTVSSAAKTVGSSRILREGRSPTTTGATGVGLGL